MIDGEEAHHAVRVTRAAAGDPVRLLNGAGISATGRITDTRKTHGVWQVDVTISDVTNITPDVPEVLIFAAPPKGDRLATMVEGISQAGATEFAPLISGRTVMDPKEDKVERLRRIAMESCKQCLRAFIMRVNDPISVPNALAYCLERNASCYIADCGTDANLLQVARSSTQPAAIFIGPEGGWTDAEREIFSTSGCQFVSLGKHVFRVEMAAVVACALLGQAVGQSPSHSPSHSLGHSLGHSPGQVPGASPIH